MSAPGTIGVITAPNYQTTNILGVDIGDNFPVYNVPGSAATLAGLYVEYNNPPFALGTRVQGTNNTKYVFCVVGTVGSVNQYDLVAIDQNFNIQQAGTVVSYVASVASAGNYFPGFNQNPGQPKSAASATYNYMWIATAGNNLLVNIASASAGVTLNSGNALYLGSAPGQITASSTAGTVQLLAGANNTTAITNVASAAGLNSQMTITVGPNAFFTTTTGLGI